MFMEEPIARPLYFDQIKGFIDKPFIKIITGLRRSGKSEFLKLVRNDILTRVDKSRVVYINFEDADFSDLKSAKELNVYFKDKMTDDGRYYFLLDEIQMVEEWEKAVNSLRLKNTDIFITGSNSRIMSDELATLLGGRTVSFNMMTLSLREFIDFRTQKGISKGDNIDFELERYIDLGGFPPVAVIDYQDKEARRIVRDINSTALLRDVIKRRDIRRPQLLDKLVEFIYNNIGSIVSISGITKYLKSQGRNTEPETVANYLKYLEDAYIIKKAPRYDIKGKRLLETNDKYYLGDHSLQYAIRDKRPDKVQAVLENIVFMELVRRGYKVSVGKLENKEIDFVAEETDGTRKIYIQVCLEFTTPETYKREFTPLKEIKDNYHKYVVTLDKNWRADEEGVMGIHLRDFLLKGDL
jgi:predicted AAA+ superfamily ATPase